MSPLCSRNARSRTPLFGRAQWGTHPGHPRTTYTSELGGSIIKGWSLNARSGALAVSLNTDRGKELSLAFVWPVSHVHGRAHHKSIFRSCLLSWSGFW